MAVMIDIKREKSLLEVPAIVLPCANYHGSHDARTATFAIDTGSQATFISKATAAGLDLLGSMRFTHVFEGYAYRTGRVHVHMLFPSAAPGDRQIAIEAATMIDDPGVSVIGMDLLRGMTFTNGRTRVVLAHEDADAAAAMGDDPLAEVIVALRAMAGTKKPTCGCGERIERALREHRRVGGR